MLATKISLGLLVAGALLLSTGPKLWAKSHRTVHFQESGTLTTAIQMDLDNDSPSDISNLGIASGKSDLGPFTDQGVAEADPEFSGKGCSIFPPFSTTGVPCKLPDGSTGCVFDVVGGSDVYRFSDGDLLFVVNELGTACVNLSTSVTTYSSSAGLISGGTGKFSGATGTLSFSGRTQNLSSDSAGRSFGWFVTTGTFELTLR